MKKDDRYLVLSWSKDRDGTLRLSSATVTHNIGSAKRIRTMNQRLDWATVSIIPEEMMRGVGEFKVTELPLGQRVREFRISNLEKLKVKSGVQ